MSCKGKVWIQLNDGNDYTILEDAVGKSFRINDFIAKVDENITFDGAANVYVASGGSSVNVVSSVESAEIWLDNSHDTKFFGKINTLNASAVRGETSLVGNEFNNTITAGRGDSKLWGGWSSSDDLLIGGGGQNTFYYEIGNGRDTVRGTRDGDIVDLTGITLDQITEARITADGVAIEFNDGGSLSVEGRADVTYQLSDGKYSANHETLEWN